MMNFHERINDLARHEKAIAALIDDLQQQRDALFDQHIRKLDSDIANLKAALETEREEIKQAARQHFLETGERDVHSHIEFRVRKKPVYDKAAALEWAQASGSDRFLRVKTELNAVEFNKAANAGEIEWSGVETVNEVDVVISKLGDILIILGEA